VDVVLCFTSEGRETGIAREEFYVSFSTYSTRLKQRFFKGF
jgi:hypothetical protein